jgi:hypothetical protein
LANEFYARELASVAAALYAVLNPPGSSRLGSSNDLDAERLGTEGL